MRPIIVDDNSTAVPTSNTASIKASALSCQFSLVQRDIMSIHCIGLHNNQMIMLISTFAVIEFVTFGILYLILWPRGIVFGQFYKIAQRS